MFKNRRSILFYLILLSTSAALGTACSDDPVPVDEPVPPPNADPNLGCNGGCHGDEYSVAPPRDLQGNTATQGRGVGAHRSHLNVAPTWYRQGECSDCHVKPAAVGDPTHIDGDNVAELTFGPRATGNGQVTPQWDGITCQNAYCHGATLSGGANTTPEWTQVNGTQSACGSCHGYPPLSPPHDAQTNDCGTCHTTMQPGTIFFLDPASHINGQVDTAPPNEQPCDSCHGGVGGNSAPPTDLAGNTTYDYPGVGAHQAHIGESIWHRQLYCSQCHVVPVSVDSPGHRDGDNEAEVYFDNLNPYAAYDNAAYSCTNLYCHGNGSTTLGTMTWTENLDLGCNSCHRTDGVGMSGQHQDHYQRGVDCFECHTTVVDQNQDFIDPELHLDGLHEVYFYQGGVWNAANRTCTVAQACHPNTRTWVKGNNN